MHEKKTLEQLFVPICIETLFYMLAGMIDTLMLSSVGDQAVGAVGTANTYIGMFIIMFSIVSTGMMTVMTQNIGAENPGIAYQAKQIGIIFNSDNDYIRKILLGDILNTSIDDDIVRDFVNEKYYPSFIEERINKDDFFTDRESAILFGVPPCFIEGILVGREYEKNDDMLKQIKNLLPECYICNLDGIVIVE